MMINIKKNVQMEFIMRDIANVTKEDTKTVAFIWFGSIAFIISIMGVMLALFFCNTRIQKILEQIRKIIYLIHLED